MKIHHIVTGWVCAFSISIFLLTSCGQAGSKADSALVQNNATASDPNAETPSASILFEQNMFDFGTIQEGDEMNHRFVFKNNGERDLIITNAVASCGCTVPEWPKTPIHIGDTAYIDVTFNSQGKAGQVEKTITVTANTRPTETKLIIKGFVQSKQ